jgi:hypothetical protein
MERREERNKEKGGEVRGKQGETVREVGRDEERENKVK